jgi:NAD(P)-dependent dehydrogenase (short-subunit alcohol dehydrogenase family)
VKLHRRQLSAASLARSIRDKGYNVVATSRNATKSKDLPASPRLALVDGDIGDASVAAKVCETAISKFGSIDALINNAAIFFPKAFQRQRHRLSDRSR